MSAIVIQRASIPTVLTHSVYDYMNELYKTNDPASLRPV